MPPHSRKLHLPRSSSTNYAYVNNPVLHRLVEPALSNDRSRSVRFLVKLVDVYLK